MANNRKSGLDTFDRHADGSVVVFPLTRFVSVTAGNKVLVRLELAVNPNEPTQRSGVQVISTPEMAKALAANLVTQVGRIESGAGVQDQGEAKFEAITVSNKGNVSLRLVESGG